MQANENSLMGLENCPHCSISTPNLYWVWGDKFLAREVNNWTKYGRLWNAYRCNSCAGVVLTRSPVIPGELLLENAIPIKSAAMHVVDDLFPEAKVIDAAIPERARVYLAQALRSLHAPDGAVMLAASAVDAMLKDKGYASGSLYERIEKAVKDNVLTDSMGKWAHKVRLDANDVRHADLKKAHYTSDGARQVLAFAEALGQFLFVLPALVKSGIEAAENTRVPSK